MYYVYILNRPTFRFIRLRQQHQKLIVQLEQRQQQEMYGHRKALEREFENQMHNFDKEMESLKIKHRQGLESKVSNSFRSLRRWKIKKIDSLICGLRFLRIQLTPEGVRTISQPCRCDRMRAWDGATFNGNIRENLQV